MLLSLSTGLTEPTHHVPNSSVKSHPNAAPKTFERRSLIDKAKQYFVHGVSSHGALSERVLLYGVKGVGKRTIAAQVAKEITQQDGRRILWLSGIGPIAFLRDYFALYFHITGKHLPHNISLAVTLAKIRQTLEERRQEWFMVIEDLGDFFDDDLELDSLLPVRGHILVTSSTLIVEKEHSPSGARGGDRLWSVPGLNFARTASQIYVGSLSDLEVDQFARQFCPQILNISCDEFGPIQRSARTFPVFLKITAINLQLLRVDFAAYRRLFEKRLDHKSIKRHPKFNPYHTAINIATTFMWEALGDYDLWSRRLLIVVSVGVYPIPLRLIKKLSIFSRPISDHLSPALDLLRSLGLLTISNESDDPQVSIMHSTVSYWVGTHVSQHSRREVQRMVLSWTSLLSTELRNEPSLCDSQASPTVSTPYDSHKTRSLLPLIRDVVAAIPFIGLYPGARRKPQISEASQVAVLDFLMHAAETIVRDRRVMYHANMLVDEAYKVLFELTHIFLYGEYQVYFLRIKHIQIQIRLDIDDLIRAEQAVRVAKRTLRSLTLAVQNKPNFTTGEASTSSADVGPIPRHTDKSSKETASIPFPSLCSLTQRTENLETQLLFAQGRYTDIYWLLSAELSPTPSSTSASNPYVLATRYCLCVQALCAKGEQSNYLTLALQWSHAAMCIWATFDETERWSSGTKGGIEVLGWVEWHTELLMRNNKPKGALMFLPRLLDTWVDLVPKGNERTWSIAGRLVDCYIKLDMIGDAEQVVEEMLEILNSTSNGMTDLSGLGGSPTGGGYDRETVGSGTGRERFWAMLVELARGYAKVGSVIVAEGILRYCLGSWRRRHVGSLQSIRVFSGTKASEEEKAEAKKFEDDENKKLKEDIKAREATWKMTAPVDWWACLIDVLVMQGKTEEPEELVNSLKGGDSEAGFDELENAFLRRLSSYKLMKTVYQRAIWAHEDGHLREWKMILGESRNRFLLRRAVAAFGSVTGRVREKRDFQSDIDLHLESHAKKSRILNLLDRTWEPDSGFVQRWDGPARDLDDVPPSTRDGDQTFLAEFWRMCLCRRKKHRDGFLFEHQFKRLRFARLDEWTDDQPKPLKQMTLDAWVYIMVPTPPPRPKGCGDDCPCIDANIAGLAEQAAIEKTLWNWKEIRPRVVINEFRHRYRGDKPDCNNLPNDEMSAVPADKITSTRTWMWWQQELWGGDSERENYIVKGMLDIPGISISLVVEQEDLDADESEISIEEGWESKEKEMGEIVDEWVKEQDGESSMPQNQDSKDKGNQEIKIYDDEAVTDSASRARHTTAQAITQPMDRGESFPVGDTEENSTLGNQKVKEKGKQKAEVADDQAVIDFRSPSDGPITIPTETNTIDTVIYSQSDPESQRSMLEKKVEEKGKQKADTSNDDAVTKPTSAKEDQLITKPNAQPTNTGESSSHPNTSTEPPPNTQPPLQMKKYTPKPLKRPKDWRFISFDGSPLFGRRGEDIKPYLMMDQKTIAKYEERAKKDFEVVVLDEYYMPVESYQGQEEESKKGEEGVTDEEGAKSGEAQETSGCMEEGQSPLETMITTSTNINEDTHA